MRIPGLAALRRAAWEAALTPIVPNTRRRDLLQRLGLAGVADGVLISDGVVLAPPRRISIGEGSFLNRQVFVDTEVHLGRHVFVGPRAMFVTTRHPVGGPPPRGQGGPPHQGTRTRSMWATAAGSGPGRSSCPASRSAPAA